MYVPVKGSTFAKVTRFLRELGIVCKCEEEGWNDLSDQILQTLREPFRRLIPFQFQPNQQSRLICVSNPPLASVPGNDNLHRCEGSILSRDRGQDVQDIGGDKLFSGSTLHSRASSRLTTHRVIKTKRKQGATFVRRQLRSFVGDIVLHQAPGSEKTLPVACHTNDVSRAHRSETRHSAQANDLHCQFPQAPTEYRIFAPEEPGQWHVSSQLSINDREIDPLSGIPSNSAEHDVDQQQRTGQSITDTLEPERTGFGRISALLNHDINTPAIRAIQFEKRTIQQIVLERVRERPHFRT